MSLSDEAAAELVSLTGVVLLHDDVEHTLDAICRVAVRVVEPADGASLTTLSEKGGTAVAASDEWARRLDEMQYVEHEGPCIDAARSGLLFRVRDMATEPRWPSYMPRAVEHGARSMISVPLTTESKTIGALNIYSCVPDAFGSEDASIARIVAGHASLASQVAETLFGHQMLGQQLREAMASRAPIEQAKGVIMATTGRDADAAFKLMVDQSQQQNRKLRDIAAEVVARTQRRAGG